MDDPTPQIYEALDRAGLQASSFYNTRKSMDKIVLEVRAKLLEEMKAIIEKRERTAEDSARVSEHQNPNMT